MKNILIIEDSADSAEMLSMLLEFQGHAVTCAASGGAGIALATSSMYDVIITDLGLPDMCGMDLIRNLFRIVGGKGGIIVALTGSNDSDVRREAQEAGVTYFFAKGEEISELLALIN